MLHFSKTIPTSVALLPNGRMRKIDSFSNRNNFDRMEELISRLILSPDPLVVPVYEYKTFLEGGKYNISYDMFRCGILTEAERHYIAEVSEANWYNKPWNDSPSFPELSKFLHEVIDRDEYHDIHSGNIMLNEQEKYCLIDLEGFIF